MLDQEQCSEVFAPENHIIFFVEMLKPVFPGSFADLRSAFAGAFCSCSLLEDTDVVFFFGYISFSE